MGTILSNVDLMNIMKFLNIKIVGVFSKDKMPKPQKGLFIINLDDSNNGGTHWTMCSTLDNNVIYYDSFGEFAPIQVDTFIKQSTGKSKYLINRTQVQYLTATYCGWFVVAFIWHIVNSTGSIGSKMKSFNNILNSESLKHNYDKLLSYIQIMFR